MLPRVYVIPSAVLVALMIASAHQNFSNLARLSSSTPNRGSWLQQQRNETSSRDRPDYYAAEDECGGSDKRTNASSDGSLYGGDRVRDSGATWLMGNETDGIIVIGDDYHGARAEEEEDEEEEEDSASAAGGYWYDGVPSPPLVVASSKSLGHHGACRRQLRRYLRELRNGTLWAVQMFDASAKQPYGVLDGLTRHLGSFDQCYGLRAELPGSGELVRGRYCLVDYRYERIGDGAAQTGGFSRGERLDFDFDPNDSAWESVREKGDFRRIKRYMLQMALCVPAACAPADIEAALREPFAEFAARHDLRVRVRVDERNCQSGDEEMRATTGTYVFCAILATILALVTTSTLYDSVGADLRRDDEEAISWSARQLLLCFSARRNLRTIFEVSHKHRGLDTIHFYRFFFIACVMVGHRMMQYYLNPMVNGRGLEEKMSRLGSLADGSLWTMNRGCATATKPSPPVNTFSLMQTEEEPRMIGNTKNETFTNTGLSFTGQGVRPNLISGKDSDREQFEIGAHGYGKNNVKLLYVHRENAFKHEIREYEIDVHLRLVTQRDYVDGDNRDIIATDSQKNTVYLLAKKHGVKSPEEFAILLCSHFLYQYRHVEEVNINVEEYPWSRHEVNGVPHNHAFVFTPTATRYCQVTQLRNESPKIRGGLKNLRVLKTTQSSFTDFIQDDYRTLPDSKDRIFSTVVTANWDFSTASGVNFDNVWQTVKNCILENFAGPPDTGVYSPSVQNTLYLAEKAVLSKVNQIYSIQMQMPNKHYFDIDFSKFSKLVTGENKEVYWPTDKPSGIIYAQLNRKDFTSRL